MLRKIALFLGVVFIMSFNFLSLEYFLYSIYQSRIMYLAYILFLTIVVVITNLLYKLNLFNRLISTFAVLLSIGISLLGLRYVVFLGI